MNKLLSLLLLLIAMHNTYALTDEDYAVDNGACTYGFVSIKNFSGTLKECAQKSIYLRSAPVYTLYITGSGPVSSAWENTYAYYSWQNRDIPMDYGSGTVDLWGEIYVINCGIGQYFNAPKKSCTDRTTCPLGQVCMEPYSEKTDLGSSYCESQAQPQSGNPIRTATGNKFQAEADLKLNKSIEFTRFYNSTFIFDLGLGTGWRHNYSQKIIPVKKSSYEEFRPSSNREVHFNWLSSFLKKEVIDPEGFLIEREDGRSYFFNKSGITTDNSGFNPYKLMFKENGFIVKVRDTSEYYDASGKLLKIEAANGLMQTLNYSPEGYLSQVVDSFGNEIKINYAGSSRINNVSIGGVRQIGFVYEGSNLIQTKYADGSSKSYVYADPKNNNLLTGITDESGNRFATWTYNDQGQAISSEHAGGVDKYTLNFGGDQTVGPRWTDETDPLGSVRRYNFKKVAGSWLLDGKNQPGGAGCSAATNGLTYDANGNIASRTDFNGNKTSYVYDLTRNLETSRTEAVGTPQVRTITTAWHPTWRLPATITEPGQVTTYDYDAVTANLNSKTIAADGKTRVWTWTYFDKGLIKTATDPDGKVTSYTYDIAGNLATLTNPLNQITQFTRYDANGNLLEMTAADGIKTTLTYDARNRLKTRQTGTALASYDYWPTGLLKQAALPNGQIISYVYDAAHRLSGVSDNRGNTATYRLNNLGQPEQVDQNDPDGTLNVGLVQAQQLQAPINAITKEQLFK